jgi:hypothetical protein
LALEVARVRFRSSIPVIPAFGDARSRVTAGQAPDVDQLVVERNHCVYRDSERVFCFPHDHRARAVAKALGGVVRRR